MDNKVALGVDIGGTNTVYGLIDAKGAIYQQGEIPTNSTQPVDHLVSRLYESTTKYLAKNGALEMIGIGIGAPNANHKTGMIDSPPNLDWESFDIRAAFGDYFNQKTFVTNDANAAALGEKNYGIAKDMDDFVEITLGTGLGSGVFSGGALVYGYSGFAGEVGHVSIDPNGRKCKCGKRGCLESYASATGVKNTILEFLEDDPQDLLLNQLNSGNINGAIIDSEYDKGNKTARKIYQYTGQKLGIGLAQVAAILSPEAFIFYGGFSNAGTRLLKYAKISMEEQLLECQKNTIRLLPSGLPQGKAGILGAASLVWEY